MSLHELVTAARDGAKGVQGDFTAPDDDWAPALLLETPAGYKAVRFELTPDREFNAFLVASLVAEHRASAVAMVTSAWLVEGDAARDAYESRTRPSQHPDRREVVTITALSRDTQEVWQAPILRSTRRPPRLGHWTRHSTDDGEAGQFDVGGLLGDAIKDGLMPRPQG